MMIYGIPLIDLACLAVFVVMWVGYTFLAENRKVKQHTLSAVMARHRHTWMRAMCDRDNRIADISAMGNLMRSVSFFASASILILGGLAALMGAGKGGYAVYREMPFAADAAIETFELKVLLLACIFVYAFFQFTWSLRQFNYCCILMGAAPDPQASASTKNTFAAHTAILQDLAANTFNRGLRAYYFALAMLTWFVHPWLFTAATALVVAVLYRREFKSKSLKSLKGVLDG